MVYLKTHYQVRQYGNEEEKKAWEKEGLIQDKAKFCDGLMLKESRGHNFTKKTDDVDCLKCQKKIDVWCKNNFDIPY